MRLKRAKVRQRQMNAVHLKWEYGFFTLEKNIEQIDRDRDEKTKKMNKK